MSDLDDFFAKKDKKGKNKTVKKKGLSNDDLDKKFDEKSSDTTSDKIKARKYVNFDNYVQDAEAEWNDFNDDENKDYSGLKIQTLSMKDKEEVQREEEESTKKEQALPAWKEGGEEQSSAPDSQPEKAVDSDFVSLFRNRNQIKINDSSEFPDLGTPSEAFEELKGFQTVRTTGPPRTGAGTSANESISTDNKYQALKNNSN